MTQDQQIAWFRFGEFEVCERELRVTRDGRQIAVEPKAFRVLLHLLRNPGRLIPKDELIAAGWGDSAVTDNSLTRNIALLRRILGDDPHDPRYIETVSTVGYRFIAKIENTEHAPGEPMALEEPNRPGAERNVRSSKKRWSWALAGGGIVILGLAATIWYLHRPLPPPRITGYTQITHDGRKKSLVGTDGTRLYFNQMSGPILPESVAQVAIAGGGIAQVPVAVPDPHIPDVSPDSELGKAGGNATFSAPYLLDVSSDGSSFLIEGPNNSTWNVRILGGSARRLPDAECGAFSPDGKYVIYSIFRDRTGSTPERDIWLVRNDGTDAHKLASP